MRTRSVYHMKEKQLITAIHRRLPKELYHHSNTYASLSTRGIPDVYYDGGCEAWIEYKQLKAMPRNGIVVGDLSVLQFRWLERRYNNALNLAHTPNVFVVVGLPNRKACIQQTPTEWREGSPVETAMDLEDIAAWITAFCFRSFGS